MTVRFVLHEYRNDEQEPNDVIPTELHDGDIVKFALDYSDWDSFVITTDKPGQDISLTFGGFNYADRTVFRLHWNGSYDIQKNGTIFLHTAQPGAYHFALDINFLFTSREAEKYRVPWRFICWTAMNTS